MIDEDSNLRPPFVALKAEDARTVRSFASYWDAARQSAGHRDRWTLNVAAIAAALAFLLIVTVAVHFRSARQESSYRISQWRSPTASLLNTPGNQFFIRMPRIEEPLIPSFKEQRN